MCINIINAPRINLTFLKRLAVVYVLIMPLGAIHKLDENINSAVLTLGLFGQIRQTRDLLEAARPIFRLFLQQDWRLAVVALDDDAKKNNSLKSA